MLIKTLVIIFVKNIAIEMSKEQIENFIEIVGPSEPFVSPYPEIKWAYKNDFFSSSVDIVFKDLKTFEQIWFYDVDGRAKKFTPKEPLPDGYYEIRLRSSCPIRLQSQNRRVGIVSKGDIEEVKKHYRKNRRPHLGPRALNPCGMVKLSDLEFKWKCTDPDVQCYVVQVFHEDSGKMVKSWKGLSPFKFSLKTASDDTQNLFPGLYYWRVRAVFFEKDILSEPLNIEIIQEEDLLISEEDKYILCGESEEVRAQQFPETIKVSDVGIMFKRAESGRNWKISRSLTSIFKKHSKTVDFWALRNVEFTIREGDILGIIGNNGAGKSTLLKLLVGVLSPDRGSITINGKVSSLLSLGAGSNPDLSGRENIYLSGIYMGLRKKEIDEKYQQIVRFAELEDFIETQVRYYSSGMKARLGFSVAVHVDPEILVIDEVLSAGDKDFRRKAEAKMKEFMEKAKAIIIASHSTKLISDMCSKCLWLEKGQMKAFGPAGDVVKAYLDS